MRKLTILGILILAACTERSSGTPVEPTDLRTDENDVSITAPDLSPEDGGGPSRDESDDPEADAVGSIETDASGEDPGTEPLDGDEETDAAGDVSPRCPTPQARPTGVPRAEWASELEVPQYTTIQLQSDYAATDLWNNWSVTRRPEESSATLSPSGSVPSPRLTLDSVGLYEVTLDVYDGDVRICQPSLVVEAIAIPYSIEVELIWTAEGGEDWPADSGPDLDLHLMHPNGVWDASPWDCHWKNRNPDWGVEGTDDDDPTLIQHISHSGGPERIVMTSSAGTADDPTTYAVGVFVFSDTGWGEFEATVRIKVDGVLVFEGSRSGLDDQSFWDVARIEWPSETVTPVDTYHSDGFP